MNTDQFAQELSQNFTGKILRNEPLGRHTTMHVGGPAEVFVQPETEESLVAAVKLAEQSGLEYFVLGGGSNTVFRDEGLPVVITTRAIKSEELRIKNGSGEAGLIHLPSGASWGTVISFCKKNDLAGFESFTGLSGTVGGAVYMNATCFGLTTSDRLVSVRYLDLTKLRIKNEELIVETYVKNPADFSYKKSPFQDGGKIILSADFKVEKGFNSERSEEVLKSRQEKGHFKAPSSGSAFKNIPEKGIIAGKLIDQCGLKGFAVGGARIADWHGNFIINPDQKATAKDIQDLEAHVIKVVKEKTGVTLESEILFV